MRQFTRLFLFMICITIMMTGCRRYARYMGTPEYFSTGSEYNSYWRKDIDSLYEEYITNPCFGNKRAAIHWISISWRLEGDSEEVRLAALDKLYACAIYARDNWHSTPIDACGKESRNDISWLIEQGWSLGEAMQVEVFKELENYSQSHIGHPAVEKRAHEMLMELEPTDKNGSLHQRWEKTMERAASER